MKRHSLLLLFAVAVTTAPLLAQTEKGNGLVSGGLSLGYLSSPVAGISTNTQFTPSLNLTVGKFVKDDWLLGVGVLFNGRFNKYTANTSRQNSAIIDQRNHEIPIQIRPFVRHYWKFNQIQLFAGGGLTVDVNNSRSTSKTTSIPGTSLLAGTTSRESSSLSVNPYIEIGANYFLTKRLSLQATVAAYSLPIGVGAVGLGLVYWTGTGSTATQPTGTANPQTDRGRWVVEAYVGGGRSRNSSEDPSASGGINSYSNSGYDFSFYPSVGHFVSKNTVLGLSLISSFRNGNNTPRTQRLGVSPYWQHYWANNRLTPFTRIGVAYTQTTSEGTDNKTADLGASGSIGLAYMVGKRFIIETALLNASVNRQKFFSISNNADEICTTATLSGQVGSGFSLRYVM